MFLLNVCFIICYLAVLGRLPAVDELKYLKLLILINLIWVSITYSLRSYHLYRTMRVANVLAGLAGLLIVVIALTEAFISITNHLHHRTFLLVYYASIWISIPAWRVGMIHLLKWYRKKGYNYRRVIIAGIDDAALELYDFFNKHPEHGYRFKGFFDDKNTAGNQIADIEAFVQQNKIDEIYCSLTVLSNEQIEKLVDLAENNLMRINFLSKFKIFNYKKLKIDFYDDIPVLIFRRIPLDEMLNKTIKRTFDIAFSGFVAFFILSWLLPLLAILIKLDSPGPVFFRQVRNGINNKTFWCYKLRTMRQNHEAHSKQATKNDSRITRIGRFLRKSSLDELPQFFNVLYGNMSVVGPRPHMVKHTEQYSQVIDKYMVRHFIKPGITGLSQVRGFRGETDDPALMKGRVRVDIFYIENWSFVLDLRIIIETAFSIFRKNGNNY